MGSARCLFLLCPEINSCRMQYLYQGMAPGSGGDYNRLPWRLGLLTQTNSNC
jgi:endo-1,4-beta-xylanase